MEKELITLFVGFILSTVLGGLLGYFFQNRTWNHQHKTVLSEAERTTAKEIFERISKLMDKRIYRMRLLNWYLEENKIENNALEKYIEEYRKVLIEWNDTLISNIALIEAYFGREIRTKLEDVVYEEFVRIGKLIENQIVEWHETDGSQKGIKVERKPDSPSRDQISEWRKPRESQKGTKIGRELDQLSHKIYQLNFDMIRKIQEGKVGINRK